MGVKIPNKERWSQRWTDRETKEIQNLAEKLRHECPMDNNSLWLSAEGQYVSGDYPREFHEKRR